MSVMESLLATSTAIGTDKVDGEERVVWRTAEGVEFTTSYADAATYGPK